MKTKENQADGVQTRLIKIYREYSHTRRVDTESQMCNFWNDPTVEILVGSDELCALENEFGIEFDDDSALDLYDMTIKEATVLISSCSELTKQAN